MMRSSIKCFVEIKYYFWNVYLKNFVHLYELNSFETIFGNMFKISLVLCLATKEILAARWVISYEITCHCFKMIFLRLE